MGIDFIHLKIHKNVEFDIVVFRLDVWLPVLNIILQSENGEERKSRKKTYIENGHKISMH